ncbi:MAG TPA: DALR domain-containing protein, partial [Anaerolineales bacterium]
KSLGNLVTIEEFLAEHEGDVLRMMVLNSSYRNPLTFGDEIISQAEKGLERLRLVLRPPSGGDVMEGTALDDLNSQIEATRKGFVDCMDDDFNTAGALGYLFELVRGINQAKDAGVSAEVIAEGQNLLRELMMVLGLRPERAEKGDQAAAFIQLLIDLRRELRQQKLWALADKIRADLAERGVLLEDTKDGTTWRWK